MLSIHIHDDAIKGAAYHADHLASGSSTTDYYAKGEAAPGRYFGKGAARLHLSGQTRDQAIERLFDNRDPATNQPLTQRRKSNAKAAWDMTFSAPKSISIMSLVFDDKRVVEAHNKALEEALAEIEKRAMARVRINGDNTDRLTGNLVGAQFMHFTSRESDPQLHHHCLVFNATYDEVEQKWKALQTAEIYRRSTLITAVYRSALARELHQLGYATESNGREGIEIKGVSREVIDLFSKRHRQIEEIAAQRDAADNPELAPGSPASSAKRRTLPGASRNSAPGGSPSSPLNSGRNSARSRLRPALRWRWKKSPPKRLWSWRRDTSLSAVRW